MEFGIVDRCTEGLFRYRGWPTVCRDENGKLFVSCSGHRLGHLCPFGKDLLYTSRDDGKTWSSPRVVTDTCADDRDAGIVPLGGGKMLLTWFNNKPELLRAYRGHLAPDPYSENAENDQYLSDAVMNIWDNLPEEKLQYGSFIKLSDDGGESWSDAIRVPVTSPHGPTVLPNGKLLYLGKEFFSEKYEKDAILAFESSDGGKTWDYLSKVECPPELDYSMMHEPCAAVLPDGTIMGAIRVHLGGLKVYTCFSYDGGRTWTTPKDLGVEGAPPHILVHSSGKVIVTYGRRVKPFGERAVISSDGGKTFGKEIVISEESAAHDLGYPSSVELPDGDILTVYYQMYKNDKYCSILYTKWALSDEI